MAESVRRYGVDGKKRFSVKYPDGRIERYGTCDDKQDERFDITSSTHGIWDENKNLIHKGETLYYLTQYQKDDTNYSQPVKQRFVLPDGVLVANGYYDYEHDNFVTPEEFLKQE